MHKSVWLIFISLQNSELFSSQAHGTSKNLMFKDSAKDLVRLPSNTDSFLYLGAEYASIIASLEKGTTHRSRCIVLHIYVLGNMYYPNCQTHTFTKQQTFAYVYVLLEPSSTSPSTAIKWCAVGSAEREKCAKWRANSMEGANKTIECEEGQSVEDCLNKIMVKQKRHKLESSFAPFFNFGL